MGKRSRPRRWAIIAIGLFAAPAQGLCWGATGHRLIGRLAVQTLPADAPAFLRAPTAVEVVGELAREPDRSKAAGREHDSDRDAAHYVNVDDDGRILGGPILNALPVTREDYEAALRAAGVDGWKAGYLPYSIIDGYEQLAKDFAYWRADDAASRSSPDPKHRAWLVADRDRREALILRDIGALGHYVGDGSQPMHVSIHFNGWGPWPNPEAFTLEKVHAPFEGAYVRANVNEADVRAALSPPRALEKPVSQEVAAYLARTNAQVVAFYRLEKAGAFAAKDGRGVAFAAARLAEGASELRDLVQSAWRVSESEEVGYPPVKVKDIEAGRVDPFDPLFGED
jgi:hypothetical protein